MTTYESPYFKAEQYPKELDGFDEKGTPLVPEGLVELRVHGVAGGTPEHNLGDPHPIQINGDSEAGVYRRHDDLTKGPKRTVEAYNWSAVNSGRTARAFWILLFPFAAANFAGWLLPADMNETRGLPLLSKASLDPRGNRLIAQSCVRALALLITALAMVGMAAVTIDIIGLQCSVEGACDRSWLSWTDRVRDALGNQPNRLAIIGGIVPLLALGILWYLGKRSTKYETFGTSDADGGSTGANRHIDTIRVDSVDFWQAPDTVYIQGWLHTSVALSTLAIVLASTLRFVEAADGSPSVHYDTYYTLGIAATAWLAALSFIVLMVARMKQSPPGWLQRSFAPAWRPRLTWIPGIVPAAILLWIALLGWGQEAAYPILEAKAGAESVVLVTTPVVEPIRNGLIVIGILSVPFLLMLGMLVGALRVIVIIVTVGSFWYAVLRTDAGGIGGPDPFEWFDGRPWSWVAIEAVLAVIFLIVILWRSSAGEDTYREYGLLWILGFAGILIGFAIGADARGGDVAWWVAAVSTLIVVLYIFVAFAIRLVIGRSKSKLDAPPPGTMRTGTAFVMAGVAFGSALTATAATLIWIARALGTAVPHTGEAEVVKGEIAYPAEASWFALAAFAGILILLGLILVRLLALRLFRWTNSVAEAICQRYDDEPVPAGAESMSGCQPGSHEPQQFAFAKAARTKRLLANLVDDVDWIATGAMMTTFAVLTASVIARWVDAEPDGRLNGAIGASTWVLGFVVVGVFLLVRSSTDSQGLRASVGILWDVMSFFPRRFHPLAPPCYSERTVIEVRNRLVEYSKEKGAKGTILLAHSQGSMITVAALLSLRTDQSLLTPPVGVRPVPKKHGGDVVSTTALDNLAYVTYGCMLERLFRRAWPDQLRRGDLVDLKAQLEFDDSGYLAWTESATDNLTHPAPQERPVWMNFGRYTDYLGGRVFAPLQSKPSPTADSQDDDARVDDIMFGDPTRRWRFRGETSHARAYLHSFNYESDAEDPSFRKHVWEWADNMS